MLYAVTVFIAMLVLIWLWVLGIGAQQQSTLTQPPLIETDVLTLKRNNSSHPLFTFTTTVSLMQAYQREPAVYLSLVSLDSLVLLSSSTFLQSLDSLYSTKFVIKTIQGMTVGSHSERMAEMKIMYLAYDYPTYPFLQLNQIRVSPDPGEVHQLIQVLFPVGESLDPSKEYLLNAFLTGYDGLELTGTPWLYVDVLQHTVNDYLLDLQLDQLSVQQLLILRILVDKTEMEARVTGPSDLICSTGTIIHFSDPAAIENNPEPSYLPFAMIYGIKGWQGLGFKLPDLTNIFRNSKPPIQANIGYLLLQTKTCPSNQGYVIQKDLCYGLSAAFYYQLTPETMAPCPYSCYQCVGPLSTNCQSCVEGWNRYLSGGRCLCLPGFYDPGGPICLNCTEAIEGCYTCSSATNCLTCLSGCTAIGFSPIYCDCPNHVQSNYSFNCPENFFYEYDRGECLCLPQTYLESPGLCFPCPKGCYLCVGETHCLLCLDSYILVGTSCLFYYSSYVLLGQISSWDSPEARCLRWDSSNSRCLQKCTQYYYKFNCYGECPLGTFPVTSPWLTCQPCKITCQYCYNFTVCYQCHPDYFYFNSTTFACERCAPHCRTCHNYSYCISCDSYYSLANDSCHSEYLAEESCPNCTYCLLSQCLICQDSFYLNLSTYACASCHHPGFSLDPQGICQEICGDGLVVYADCDDGNLAAGDGCSPECKIEAGFNCQTYQGRSRCWSVQTTISWHFYNIFGANQLILEVVSPADLSSAILDLSCSFDWSMIDEQRSVHLHQFTVEYRQSTVLPMNLNMPSTYAHIAGRNASNRCLLEIDGLVNYTIVVNTVPESLLVDYKGTQAIAESESMRTAVTAMGLTAVAVLALGLGPTNAFATLRISILLLVGYMDYCQIPINSFAAYRGLEGVVFSQPSISTQDLASFSSEHYLSLLWKACTFSFGILILHEVVLRLLLKGVQSVQWDFSTRLCRHLLDNKGAVFRYVSTAYEGIWWVWVFRVASNFGQASVGVLLLAGLLLGVMVAAKVHLYFTLPQLSSQSPHMCHSLLTDQLENIVVALLVIFSSPVVSYTSPALLLFSTYSLASLLLSDKTPLKGPFYISQTLALYHYAFCLGLFLLVQALKCVNMWRPIDEDYEQFSVQLGLAISLLSMGIVVLSCGLTILGASIRLCEVKLEGQKEEEVVSATGENMSVNQSEGSH